MSEPQKCPHCPSETVWCVSRQPGDNRESWRCERGHSFVYTRSVDEAARAPVQRVIDLHD